MGLRKSSWASLVNDENEGGSLVPIFALAHENHADPAIRSYKDPIDDELREKLIVGAAVGVIRIFDYFESARVLTARNKTTGSQSFRRLNPKVGRNEPCPCGSGKKFKHCCGTVTIH